MKVAGLQRFQGPLITEHTEGKDLTTVVLCKISTRYQRRFRVIVFGTMEISYTYTSIRQLTIAC